jgi:TonB family protein
MFLDFYKLREQPFGETPDPRYLYLSRTHREAIASLVYGIEAGRGFLALIAEPGMGKTTLLFHLLKWLRERESARTAFLFQTQCGSRGLLRFLLGDVGINTDGKDLAGMHQQLNEFLISQASAGKRFVVFIDEAQNLRESVLETVRLLSNFENPRSKLIQIILAGQPQLADTLARPALAQLRQRVSILSWLSPFTRSETYAYINRRLSVAGSDGCQLFTPEARAMIATWSRGVPRNINNLCFHALSLGYAMGKDKVDCSAVQEAASDLEMSPVVTESCDSQRAHAFLASPGAAPPPVSEVAPPKEEVAGASELDPPRQEFEAVVTSTDPGNKDATSPPPTRTHSWMRTIAFVGTSLVALFMVSEAGTFFLHHVMAQPAIMNSALIPTVKNSTGAARPSHSLLKAPKKNAAWAAKVLDDKLLASPAAVSRSVPAIDQDTPPDLTGVLSDAPSMGTQGVLAGSSNILPMPPPIPEENVPVDVGGRVKEPRLAFKVAPIYPPEARQTGVEGEVVIDAVIDANGKPTKLKVVSGPALLQLAALDSVREWQYEPVYLHDKPVPVEMLISVEFRLH